MCERASNILHVSSLLLTGSTNLELNWNKNLEFSKAQNENIVMIGVDFDSMKIFDPSY